MILSCKIAHRPALVAGFFANGAITAAFARLFNDTNRSEYFKKMDAQRAALAKRPIAGITIYRKDIDLNGQDKYGHWWVELNGNESYGWWPKNPVNYQDTILGVTGELNAEYFGGSYYRDRHQGDRSSGVNAFTIYSNLPKEVVAQQIRSYAQNYSGSWSWPVGQNCHSFQQGYIQKLGLEIRPVQ